MSSSTTVEVYAATSRTSSASRPDGSSAAPLRGRSGAPASGPARRRAHPRHRTRAARTMPTGRRRDPDRTRRLRRRECRRAASPVRRRGRSRLQAARRMASNGVSSQPIRLVCPRAVLSKTPDTDPRAVSGDLTPLPFTNVFAFVGQWLSARARDRRRTADRAERRCVALHVDVGDRGRARRDRDRELPRAASSPTGDPAGRRSGALPGRRGGRRADPVLRARRRRVHRADDAGRRSSRCSGSRR